MNTEMGQNRRVKLKTGLLNIIFPPVCVFCMRYSANPVCEKCKDSVVTFGSRAATEGTLYIGERLYCYGKYMGILRERFIDYKFGKTLWLGRYFGKMMYMEFKNALADRRPDLVAYVPVSKKRFRERGFDQSFEMATALAEGLRVPCKPLLICRNIGGRQSGLNRNQRFSQVDGRFGVSEEIRDAKGKRILLVDDIFTTGATLNACTQLLLNEGVSVVDGMVFATGRTDLEA